MLDVARPFVVGFGIFFATYFTILLFFTKMDQNTQAYCEDAINEFVANSCSAGYISPSAYLEMTKRVNNTGNMYEVTITHDAKVVMPEVNEDGDEVEGSYVVSVMTFNNEEILEEMFPYGSSTYYNYPLNNGDEIKVSLSLKSPTLAGRLFSYISKNEVKTIRYNKSGYVGNNEDNGLNK